MATLRWVTSAQTKAAINYTYRIGGYTMRFYILFWMIASFGLVGCDIEGFGSGDDSAGFHRLDFSDVWIIKAGDVQQAVKVAQKLDGCNSKPQVATFFSQLKLPGKGETPLAMTPAQA